METKELIKDIQRTPFRGKGKPEPLKYDLTGLCQTVIGNYNNTTK